MNLVAIVLSMVVSVSLLLWLLRLKKDNPFETGTVVKLLIFGAISCILVSVVTIGLGLIKLFSQFGYDNIVNLFQNPSTENVNNFISQLKQISSGNEDNSFLREFKRTFIMVGLMEEIFKFLAAKLAIRKSTKVNTWFDMVIVMALSGLGFQIFEDLIYLSDNIISTLVRALTPFHFCFGVMMGYFYGKYKVTGNKLYMLLSILIPSVIHALFDASLKSILIKDIYLIIALVMIVVMFVILFYQIRTINKYAKSKELDIYLNK